MTNEDRCQIASESRQKLRVLTVPLNSEIIGNLAERSK